MKTTKRDHDAATKINAGRDPIMSVSQYRRERGRVAGVDRLAVRRAGRIGYIAALRAIGAGRGNSALRALVHAYEVA